MVQEGVWVFSLASLMAVPVMRINMGVPGFQAGPDERVDDGNFNFFLSTTLGNVAGLSWVHVLLDAAITSLFSLERVREHLRGCRLCPSLQENVVRPQRKPVGVGRFNARVTLHPDGRWQRQCE